MKIKLTKITFNGTIENFRNTQVSNMLAIEEYLNSKVAHEIYQEHGFGIRFHIDIEQEKTVELEGDYEGAPGEIWT